MRATAAAVLAASALALLPGAAAAYSLGGQPWPDRTITYFTAAKAYRSAVDRAAHVWNRAGVGVHLARTSRARADMVVAYGGAACSGVVPMGYGGRFEETVMRLGAGCNRGFIRLTAVHEFGHVLGLDHEGSSCARMNRAVATDGTPRRCRPHSLSYWLARPLTRDDVAGAKALYSGDVFQFEPWSDRGPRRHD